MKWDSLNGKFILSDQEREDIAIDEANHIKEFCDPTKHPYMLDEKKRKYIPNPNYKGDKKK